MSCDKVSIYIPTHNRVNMLVRAVSSALNQTYPNIEVVVSDDGSSDDTELVITNWMKVEPRLKYVKSSKARGANYARNKAIDSAAGKFVTGLDDDDFFLPTRIQNFIDNYNSQYAFLYSQRKVIDKNSERDSNNYVGELNLNTLLYKNVVGNQIFIEKDLLQSINGFDSTLPSWQDYDCWVRLLFIKNKALGIKNIDYIMDVSHEKERITSSSRAMVGAEMFFKRYSKYMNNSQKKTLMSEILLMNQRNISFGVLIKHLTLFNWKKLLYRMVIR